jgi:hypothetical protein
MSQEAASISVWRHGFIVSMKIKSRFEVKIEGFVVGRVIRNSDDPTKIEFPDGQVCLISMSLIEVDQETVNRVFV